MAKKGTKSTKKKSAYSKKKNSTSSTTKNRSTTGMPKKSVVVSANKQASTTKKQTPKKKGSKASTTKPQLSSIYAKNEPKNDSLEDILLDKLFNYHEKPKATTRKKVAKKDNKPTSKKTPSTKQTAKKEVLKEQTVDKKKKETIKVDEKRLKKVVPETPSTNVTPVEQSNVVSSEVQIPSKEAKTNIAVRILFFGFCFIVIVVFILFLNLNHIGNAVSEVVPQSDLTVSYDVSAINPETSNVTITIHASSDVGLKRILLHPKGNRYAYHQCDTRHTTAVRVRPSQKDLHHQEALRLPSR